MRPCTRCSDRWLSPGTLSALTVAIAITQALLIAVAMRGFRAALEYRVRDSRRRGAGARQNVTITPRSPYGNGFALQLATELGHELGQLWSRRRTSRPPAAWTRLELSARNDARRRLYRRRARLDDASAVARCTVTRPVCASRLALPDTELVQKPKLPSPSSTHQTGVETGRPSRRYVVNRTYFLISPDRHGAKATSGLGWDKEVGHRRTPSEGAEWLRSLRTELHGQC